MIYLQILFLKKRLEVLYLGQCSNIYSHVPVYQTPLGISPAYRPVYLHGVHISEAGTNLHPVLVDPQQVVFHEVHRQTSAGKT